MGEEQTFFFIESGNLFHILCRQGEVKYIEVFYHAFLASRFRDNDDITLNKKAQSYLCNRFSIPFSNCFQYFIREKIIASFRKWSPCEGDILCRRIELKSQDKEVIYNEIS